MKQKRGSDGKTQSKIRNQRGQGLVEYLILVALMGVASISVLRGLSHIMKGRFANIAYSLHAGKPKKAKIENIKEDAYKKSDLSDFMNGAVSGDR